MLSEVLYSVLEARFHSQICEYESSSDISGFPKQFFGNFFDFCWFFLRFIGSCSGLSSCVGTISVDDECRYKLRWSFG